MICYNCGNNLRDGIKVCNVCGTPVQPLVGQQSNISASQKAPIKKKRTGLVLGIIILVLFLLTIVGGIILGVSFFSSLFSDSTTPVNRGVYEYNQYINDSIDLTFTNGYDWTFYSDEELANIGEHDTYVYSYSDFEQAIREQGHVYLMGSSNSTGTMQTLVCIEDVSMNPYIDEYEYIVNSLGSGFEITSQSESYVAGNTYYVVDCKPANSYSSLYQRCYVRKQGDYMVAIMTSAVYESSLSEIEYMFS